MNAKVVRVAYTKGVAFLCISLFLRGGWLKEGDGLQERIRYVYDYFSSDAVRNSIPEFSNQFSSEITRGKIKRNPSQPSE